MSLTSLEASESIVRGEWSRLAISCWSGVAVFGTYFCMYGFRKPFTAAEFSGGMV